MTMTGEPTVEEQPCGCKTTTYPIISNGTRTEVGPIVMREPCLACALTQAGQMLQQAGMRLAEAAEREQEEMEENAEAARRLAEDTIGGGD